MYKYNGYIIKQIRFGVVVYFEGDPIYFPTEQEAMDYIDSLKGE